MEYNFRLADVPKGQSTTIHKICCSARDASRLAPLGIVRGTDVEVLRNSRGGAVLVEVRNTVVALSRFVAENITVREGSHEQS
ncbi:MAG TPA: hypothetical protein DCS48_07790 [Desulfovibrio sp.]|nr:hypothetical protein [Desulfovibrio sp.]